MVRKSANKLRGVVLLGVDQDIIATALAAHAPSVPVVRVTSTSPDAMDEVVRHCAELAQPGDTVLLAPGCASWDMFRDYSDRGQSFARAVRNLA